MTAAVFWFRRDLRLDDNPGLLSALRHHHSVILLYIHAPQEEAPWSPGSASRWWLHYSLEALSKSVRARGSRLVLRTGPTQGVLRDFVDRHGVTAIYWNRLYDPAIVLRDTGLKTHFRNQGISCRSTNAALLLEPWQVSTKDGAPYRVFTPFWKACRARLEGLNCVSGPSALPPITDEVSSEPLESLQLLPRVAWDAGLRRTWHPGEEAARAALDRFLVQRLERYASERDRPAASGTSGLSPHLHFGEISPRRIVRHIRSSAENGHGKSADVFRSELGWREFAHHILYHFPRTPEAPLNSRFEVFPWREPVDDVLSRWQRGQTGIPIVDAGMRQLWRTGWMHNRVRMIVGSLLTKNLRVPWQHGARWFWDTLVDADLASNTMGWQWVSGCGADAAPYFRIFNPLRQGERFDPKGAYVRQWVPELAYLPDAWVHSPWAAPPEVLSRAGVELGRHYPQPLVDLAASRQEALAAFEAVKLA